MFKKLFFCLAILFLHSCATQQPIYPNQKNIYDLAKDNFMVQKFTTSDFNLYGLLKQSRYNNKNLHIYIEGDGLAWLNRTTPSKNPTPTDSVTKDLAMNDLSNAAILYLARPCQYLPKEEIVNCDQKYWTSHRLAPEVIHSLNSAISMAKEITKTKQVSIIGFSGGGGAAALVAAMRDDVKFLGSVAGLLDHTNWVKKLKFTPLYGSLDAITYIDKIKHIPQKHIASNKDKVIKPIANKNFCEQLPPLSCESINNLNHNGDWYKVWDYSLY